MYGRAVEAANEIRTVDAPHAHMVASPVSGVTTALAIVFHWRETHAYVIGPSRENVNRSVGCALVPRIGADTLEINVASMVRRSTTRVRLVIASLGLDRKRALGQSRRQVSTDCGEVRAVTTALPRASEVWVGTGGMGIEVRKSVVMAAVASRLEM